MTIDFQLKEGAAQGDFSQVAIFARFLDPLGDVFSLPNNREYTYILKLSSIKKATESSISDYKNNIN